MAPFFTGIAKNLGGYGFGKLGGASTSVPIQATGGNIANGITPGNGYKYHTFGSTGTFTVNSGTSNLEVLIVAGGGGGGANISGGGGGAGGVVYATAYAVAPGTYTVTVGGGGAGAPSPGGTASSGTDSVFDLLTADGGGRGGTFPSTAGQTGGSGGGGLGNVPTWPGGAVPAPLYTGKSATQPTFPQPGLVPGPYNQYGGNGGTGGGTAPNAYMAGSGGGAGGNGASAPYPSPTSLNMDGGPGQPFPGFAYPLCFPSPYLPGLPSPGNPISGRNTPATSDHYGGGGGGGRHLAGGASSQGQPNNGGQGGGGKGGDGRDQPYSNPTKGVNYLGGGAGDGNGYVAGTSGGDGIVIIRYLT